MFNHPNSLYVRKERGQYYVSFCYENGVDESTLSSNAEHLAFLQGSSREFLEQYTIGIDRGVSIPAQAGEQHFDFSVSQKRHLSKADRYLQRLQRKQAKQQKGSNRRAKTKHRMSDYHGKKSNIRRDFNHQTSRAWAQWKRFYLAVSLVHMALRGDFLFSLFILSCF